MSFFQPIVAFSETIYKIVTEAVVTPSTDVDGMRRSFDAFRKSVILLEVRWRKRGSVVIDVSTSLSLSCLSPSGTS